MARERNPLKSCSHPTCEGECRKKKAPKPRTPIKRSSKPLKRTFVKRDNSDELQQWFEDRRKEMTGRCQCGCGKRSQMSDDKYFKFCICHIFPKRIFKSVETHPLNWVERAFWGGCHSVMDDTSMDRWTQFADWQDIKYKFSILAPLLTAEERSRKFYSHLERLVNSI